MRALFRAGLAALAVLCGTGLAFNLSSASRFPPIATMDFEQAEAAFRSGRAAEAAWLYERYLAIYPYDFEVRTRLGGLQVGLMRWEEARRTLEFGLELNPSTGRARHGLAAAYAGLALRSTDESARAAALARARGHASAALAAGASLDRDFLNRIDLHNGR